MSRSRRPPKPGEKEAAAKSVASGAETIWQVAKRTNRAYSVVQRWIKQVQQPSVSRSKAAKPELVESMEDYARPDNAVARGIAVAKEQMGEQALRHEIDQQKRVIEALLDLVGQLRAER